MSKTTEQVWADYIASVESGAVKIGDPEPVEHETFQAAWQRNLEEFKPSPPPTTAPSLSYEERIAAAEQRAAWDAATRHDELVLNGGRSFDDDEAGR